MAQGDAPSELVVLSWGGGWGRALHECVSRPFTASTGIAVRQVRHVGLDLPQSLGDAMRTGGRPPFDVVWSNAVPALRAARAGQCEPVSVADVAALPYLHERAHCGDRGDWPVVMAYVVPYVLVFRRAAFPHGGPTSWRALEDPIRRGRVALYPGGVGIHALAQALGGGSVAGIPGDMRACWRYLEALRPQVGSLSYSVGMADAFARGELDLCFRALPNAIAFAEEGADTDWVAPDEGVPDTLDALWVPRNLPADSAHRAKRYIDFALSRPVYDRWCERLGVIPVRTDVAPPQAVVGRPGMPRTVRDPTATLYVPEEVKLEHDAAWRTRFDGIFASSRGTQDGRSDQRWRP